MNEHVKDDEDMGALGQGQVKYQLHIDDIEMHHVILTFNNDDDQNAETDCPTKDGQFG